MRVQEDALTAAFGVDKPRFLWYDFGNDSAAIRRGRKDWLI